MSDSEESGVTYTDISSPFEELSDIGSPRADDHEHLMLPEMLEDPYVESPEYIPESDFEMHPEDDDDEALSRILLIILPMKEMTAMTRRKREVGYGITDSWDEIVETLKGAPVSTDTELGGYVREFEKRVRQDMDEIYMRLDDE
nr:hypothetical protein [Tanacetum cinerariifolium]